MNRKRFKSGQGMLEYILIVILIALAAYASVQLYGKKVKEKYSQSTQALAGQDVKDEGPGTPEPDIITYAPPAVTQPPATNNPPPSTNPPSNPPTTPPTNFGDTPITNPPVTNPPNPPTTQPPTITPPSTTPVTNPPATTPPVTPPTTPPTPTTPPQPVTPPAPPDPMPPNVDNRRHHVGDGNFSPGLGGGSLINEGTSYSTQFNVPLQQVKDANIKFVEIKIYIDGVSVDNPPIYKNKAYLNNAELGTLKNGYNIFKIPVEQFQSGTNSIRINSAFTQQYYMGRMWNEYDDFEFWNLSVTYVK